MVSVVKDFALFKEKIALCRLFLRPIDPGKQLVLARRVRKRNGALNRSVTAITTILIVILMIITCPQEVAGR